MSQNQAIEFLLPNGNIHKHKIQNNEPIFYRSISKDFKMNLPEEFIAVYDQKQKKVISKFQDKLESNNSYKLFCMPEAVIQIQNQQQEVKQLKETFIKQIDENKKLQEKINDIKTKSDQSVQDIKNQSELKISQLDQKIKELESKLLETQNKSQEYLQDLERTRFNLKQLNTQKDDMERQLKKKEADNQELINQNSKFVDQIQNLNKQNFQEKQNFQQQQEQSYHQYCQIKSGFDQWYQYAMQLDYEKKIIEQSYQEQLIKTQDQEKEIRKLKNKQEQEDLKSREEINELQNHKKSLEQQIIKLKKEAKESDARYQDELQNQKRQLNKVQEENITIKQQLDKTNSKLNNQINKNKELQDELHLSIQAKQDNVTLRIEDLQNLQRRLQQEQGQNEKLIEEKEKLEKQIIEVMKNLNTSQNQHNDSQQKVENLEKQLKIIQDESKDELNQKQEQIDKLRQQIQNLQKSKEDEIMELKEQQKEQNNQSNDKIKNIKKDIERQKEELVKLVYEKKKIEEDSANQRKALQKQISDCDMIIFQKDQELLALQNLATVPVYQFRIQRLVEQVPREYNKDIEFAIETMMINKVNLEDFIKNNKAQCQEQTFKLSQVQLHRGRADTTFYNISDQDYRQCANLINIGNITGIQCQVPVNSSEKSLDKYFFFKCLKCPEKKQLEGKFFGIKQCKKQEIDELETRETAIDNSLATIIAQDFMRKFTQELNEKDVKINFDLKFRDQYIIETKKHFKQYLEEQIKGQQLVLQNEGIKNFVEFIEALDNEKSNEFYEFTREYQLDKKQPKDGNIIKAYLEINKEKKLQDIYKKFNPENIRKQLNHFIEFIGGNVKEMPLKLYYSIQQIEILPDFTKYNGGHMKFDASPVGKFLSAFSYYSIVRSQRQLCISHLQGVKNQLYDPLVSTYDGFLDKMDQGFNEIRTFESKFLSETKVNKGIEYLNALDIK